MKASVNQDGCISCGYCVDVCPEVFKLNADDKSTVVVDKIPEKVLEQAIEARDGCPVAVIDIK